MGLARRADGGVQDGHSKKVIMDLCHLASSADKSISGKKTTESPSLRRAISTVSKLLSYLDTLYRAGTFSSVSTDGSEWSGITHFQDTAHLNHPPNLNARKYLPTAVIWSGISRF